MGGASLLLHSNAGDQRAEGKDNRGTVLNMQRGVLQNTLHL